MQSCFYPWLPQREIQFMPHQFFPPTTYTKHHAHTHTHRRVCIFMATRIQSAWCWYERSAAQLADKGAEDVARTIISSASQIYVEQQRESRVMIDTERRLRLEVDRGKWARERESEQASETERVRERRREAVRSEKRERQRERRLQKHTDESGSTW